MKYKRMVGTDINASVMTLGTWVMGGDSWWGSDHDDKRYIDTIKNAVDAGINVIDTAAGYGRGHSEEVVGMAVKGIRDKVFIASKANADILTAETAQKTVENSLRRLQTDYLDIYYIHWPAPGISVASNMEALEKLRDKGLIKYIGVSNFTTRHMDIARTQGTINVFQPAYSLLWRNIERELLPYCIENDIGVMTYSSMAMGLLSGKYKRDGNKFEDGDIRGNMVAVFAGELFEKCLTVVDKLSEIASDSGMTMAQAAINWVFSQKGISTAIIGARTPRQLEENLKAVDFELSQKDMDAMKAVTEEIFEEVADWDTMYFKKADAFEIK